MDSEIDGAIQIVKEKIIEMKIQSQKNSVFLNNTEIYIYIYIAQIHIYKA